MDKVEYFQKETAFTQNKGRRVFLVTCPNFVLITFNRSTWAERVSKADSSEAPAGSRASKSEKIIGKR